MFIFAWKNIDSFKRHMEEMESFRRAHEHLSPGKPVCPAQKTCKPRPGTPNCPILPASVFTYVNGKKTVVPIWYISMPKDSQN